MTSLLDLPLDTPYHRPQATSLFTGSEELDRLSNKQLNALLLYDDWPGKHMGPGDVEEGEGLGGLFKVRACVCVCMFGCMHECVNESMCIPAVRGKGAREI